MSSLRRTQLLCTLCSCCRCTEELVELTYCYHVAFPPC